MKIRVLDFETTGKPGKNGAPPVEIIEVGWCDVDAAQAVSKPVGFLVNPRMDISVEARAVHHLSSLDVAGGVSPQEARSAIMTGMQAGDMFAAHNAEFERALFPGDPFPWICTMMCAKHLLTGAPAHSNQVLRYYLKLDDAMEWPELSMPPHRAAPDAYVSAHLLQRLMKMAPVNELVVLTNTPFLQKTVMFGKHYGQLWSDMDVGFLRWCLDPVRERIKEEDKFAARHWLNIKCPPHSPF